MIILLSIKNDGDVANIYASLWIDSQFSCCILHNNVYCMQQKFLHCIVETCCFKKYYSLYSTGRKTGDVRMLPWSSAEDIKNPYLWIFILPLIDISCKTKQKKMKLKTCQTTTNWRSKYLIKFCHKSLSRLIFWTCTCVDNFAFSR